MYRFTLRIGSCIVAFAAAAGGAALCSSQGIAQDTGVGVDLQFGDRIDPTGGQRWYGCDPRGMSALRATPRRTPTGFMYLCPPDLPGLRAVGEWLYSATLPLGYIAAADDQNAQWQRYTGWDDSLAIGPIDVTARRPADGSYVELRGSRLNSDYQNYRVAGGRAGHYRVEVFYRDQPNVVSANAHSLWSGVGSPQLRLIDGLVPAATTPAQVQAALAVAPERRLDVQRDKWGLNATYYFSREWTAYLGSSYEQRDGARPFGGPFFFNFPFVDNGGILEIPRVIDDSTTRVNAGARFAGPLWRMEFAYAGSFYRSRFASYDYETPFRLSPVIPGATSPPLTTGVFASEPDNDYHNLRANLTRATPLNGELSVTASAVRMRQNEALLPPMNCEGQFGIDLSATGAPTNPYLFNCADWNTTAALSQKRADVTIDAILLDARAVLRPSNRVSWRAALKYHDQNYRGDYLAFNPLTGQYGYIAENGAQGSVVPTEAGVWDPVTTNFVRTRIRNLPLDKQTLEARLGGDWRLSDFDTVGAAYTYTSVHRSHRERHDVEDNSLQLTWSIRRHEPLTFRARYTYLDRSGDAYDYDPYGFIYSMSLPGYAPPPIGTPAHTVAQLRKLDVSELHRHKLDVMAVWAMRDDMTLSATVRGERNDYDALLGRRGYETLGATVQWEWQPRPATSASVWYGYDRSRLELSNVNDVTTTSNPDLGGPTYPLDAQWWAEDEQHNHYVGGTLDQQLGRVRLQLAASYIDARGTTDFSFAGPRALAWPQVARGEGNAFPAMTHEILSLSAQLQFAVSERFQVRMFDLYERGNLFDWRYRGFDRSLVYDHRVYTDQGPEDYSDNLVGLMFEFRL